MAISHCDDRNVIPEAFFRYPRRFVRYRADPRTRERACDREAVYHVDYDKRRLTGDKRGEVKRSEIFLPFDYFLKRGGCVHDISPFKRHRPVRRHGGIFIFDGYILSFAPRFVKYPPKYAFSPGLYLYSHLDSTKAKNNIDY
jgi:hypothetical protein